MKYVFITLFCFCSLLLKAQGLIIIEDSIIQRERIPLNINENSGPAETDTLMDSDYVPKSRWKKKNKKTLDTITFATEIDYSMFTPLNYPQKGGTCVAHSFSKAMSILINKRLLETDPIKKLTHHFSPYFIYFNLSSPLDKNCSKGLSIATAATFVETYGIAPLVMVEFPDFYPFSQYCLGFPYPTHYPEYLKQDFQVASLYKFAKVFRLVNSYDVKLALNRGMAVVVGMSLTEEFTKITGNSYTFESQHQPLTQGHAMVVVGYSDTMLGGAFKIANSWGENWGENGFVWMDYSSFSKLFLIAYGCSDIDIYKYESAQNFSLNTSAALRLNDTSFTVPSRDASNAVGSPLLSAEEINSMKKKLRSPKKYMTDLLIKPKD
jgi:hypothetical protein